MRTESPEVLELLTRHERSLRLLYEEFAAIYPGHRQFWLTMAGEEETHAAWLEELAADPIANAWFKAVTTLKPQAIASSSRYIEDQRARAHAGELSIIQALAIGKDLESAIIEHHLSRITADAPWQIRPTLKNMIDETEKHRKAIAYELEVEKTRVR